MAFEPFTACGFVGAALLMLAYFSNLRGWLPSNDWRFPGANVAGSAMILVSLYHQWNLPSVIIECFWAAISLYGLVRNLRQRVRHSIAAGDAGS
jgi:hypothetical protein